VSVPSSTSILLQLLTPLDISLGKCQYLEESYIDGILHEDAMRNDAKMGICTIDCFY
jgi:hypothetical protein